MAMNELEIEQVARVCHEANRAYCLTIKDASQPGWDAAPDWQRDSARAGVRFHIENPAAGPAGSHESWLRQKAEEGWKYGPLKDPTAKTHPCIKPFDQLPAVQQMKDHLFVAIVHAFTVGPID